MFQRTFTAFGPRLLLLRFLLYVGIVLHILLPSGVAFGREVAAVPDSHTMKDTPAVRPQTEDRVSRGRRAALSSPSTISVQRDDAPSAWTATEKEQEQEQEEEEDYWYAYATVVCAHDDMCRQLYDLGAPSAEEAPIEGGQHRLEAAMSDLPKETLDRARERLLRVGVNAAAISESTNQVLSTHGALAMQMCLRAAYADGPRCPPNMYYVWDADDERFHCRCYFSRECRIDAAFHCQASVHPMLFVLYAALVALLVAVVIKNNCGCPRRSNGRVEVLYRDERQQDVEVPQDAFDAHEPPLQSRGQRLSIPRHRVSSARQYQGRERGGHANLSNVSSIQRPSSRPEATTRIPMRTRRPSHTDTCVDFPPQDDDYRSQATTRRLLAVHNMRRPSRSNIPMRLSIDDGHTPNAKTGGGRSYHGAHIPSGGHPVGNNEDGTYVDIPFPGDDDDGFTATSDGEGFSNANCHLNRGSSEHAEQYSLSSDMDDSFDDNDALALGLQTTKT